MGERKKRYMTAKEAASVLGVSRATLYAYVSRGLIRSEPIAQGARRHRYRAEDVRRLQKRKAQRRDPSLAAEHALHFGAPVLASGLTLIDGERFYYRGQNALALAVTHRVEEVASFLWRGDWRGIELQAFAPHVINKSDAAKMTALERFQHALPLASAADFAAYDLQPRAVFATGERIMALLVAIAAGVPIQRDLVNTLVRGWGLELEGAQRLLNAALILCADHELNVSSFTARCVASACSTPYQVVQAGLAALQGTKHGGHTARVAALLDEVGRPQRARHALGERLRRGDPVPGFGHVLYPNGDPRARILFELMEEVASDAPVLALARAVKQQAAELVGEQPTIDFALATLARLLGRDQDGGLAIFALGRTIGWLAHALEQYEEDTMIRPRARYIGPLPSENDEESVVL
ncbi:MAG: citrate/2-methylcitrate synthase [Chloroflexota bacterium]